MYYYVYKLVDLETNEFYIGSRSSKVDPNIDNYMGSRLGLVFSLSSQFVAIILGLVL